jgi:hypothetical protein
VPLTESTPLDARFFESENLAAQWFRGSALLEARA